jgi:hypothetical protein
MAALISEVLATIAVLVPDPDQLAERVLQRCGGGVDRLAFTAAIANPERLAEQVRRLRRLVAGLTARRRGGADALNPAATQCVKRS